MRTFIKAILIASVVSASSPAAAGAEPRDAESRASRATVSARVLVRSCRRFGRATPASGNGCAGSWRGRTPIRLVALAAKMARIVWALLRHERVYEATAAAA